MSQPGKPSVDAIWRQLKQQQLTSKDSTRLESLWDHVGSSSCGDHTQTANKQLQQQAKSRAVQQAPASRDSDRQQAYDALRSGLQDGSAVPQLTLALQSRDGGAVRAALQQLQGALAGSAELNSSIPTSKLCKALLRCFDNRTESCRDMAVSSCSRLLQVDPDATLGLLPYVLPVLVERLQCDESHNPTEPSEEVRLKLVQLLSLVMDHAGTAIAAYASEVWAMLAAILVDSFHEVAMLGCKVSQQLAGNLGLRLGATSKELVAALLPLTTHKRYRVRIAAIQAIRDVMHQGAHEMILEMVAWRDPNLVPIKAFYGDDLKVNFCGKLATDQHLQVRLAFLDMVGNWLLTLRERRDHEARLLPYVLSGICDESPAVVGAALQLLDQLGCLYEQEREAELADMLRFADRLEQGAEAQLLQLIQAGRVRYAGTWDALPLSQEQCAAVHVCLVAVQQRQCTQQATADAASGSGGQATAATLPPEDGVLVLPGPFQERARLGSRLLVRGSMSSLLPALCRELSSWQSCSRAMSARLLLVSLLLAESAAEQHLQVILPALCAAVCDAEAGAAVQACAIVLGCFCPLPRLLDLLGPRMEDWAGLPQRQADGLLLLAAVLRGAGPMQLISGHGCRLLQVLMDLQLANSQDSSIRAALLQLMQQLLAPHTLHQVLASGGSPAQPHTAAVRAAAATCCDEDSKGERELLTADPPPSHAVVCGGSEGASTARGLLEQLLTQVLEGAGAVVAEAGCFGAAPGVDAADSIQHEWLAAALGRLAAAQPLG